MSKKRFSDLNDLQAIIEELEQEIDEQQSTIEQLKQENKKLKRQLNKQDTINIQYREIITCLEIIIDEMRI